MKHSLGVIRQFKTKQFHIVVDALEDYDTDLSFDETGEVLAKLQSGEYVSFQVRVTVFLNGYAVGSDALGGCIYSDIAEFQDHREAAKETRKLRASNEKAVVGSYFSGMITEACADARKTISAFKNVYVRT